MTTIRTTPNPVIRWAGRHLHQLNERHPWNHNDHFHPWILAHLPSGAQRVLDVGCGRGDLLAALRTRCPHVEGIDPDQVMAYHSATRFQQVDGVVVLRTALHDLAREESRHGTYDAITMVASLHHQDLDEALGDARLLLRPGGRLLVVTLVEPRGGVDTLWDVANALSNPVIGFVKHPRPAQGGGGDTQMPVSDASWSLAQLRERAEIILPGARVRRREGFRVTLRWEKPPAQGAV